MDVTLPAMLLSDVDSGLLADDLQAADRAATATVK
jgi:hypothetical protein